MTHMLEDSHRALRTTVYSLLIVAACGSMVGRILMVRSQRGETPLLSANDRSRWATVRSLVDESTYELDEVIFRDRERTFRMRDREWYTIDLVRHRGHGGREHFYSSKPPLFPTLMAGQYWLVQRLTGMTLAEEPFYVIRLLLITTNVLPMVLFFLLLAAMVEKYGQTDWGRLFAMTVATFGTFLTTFAVTLNNHLPAAISVVIVLWAALPIWREADRSWWRFAVCGFFAAFAVTNELPALSLFGLLGLALFWCAPSRTLLAFVPAAAVVAAGFFGTNYIAHGTWKPPYAHRGEGPRVLTLPEVPADQLDAGAVPEELRQAIEASGISLSDQTGIQPRLTAEGWVLWDPETHERLALVPDEGQLHVHQWGDWYEYEHSYWLPGRKSGVDLGEPSRAVYAFHLLFGHYGIFSLTPVWLLSAVGAGLWLLRAEPRMRGLAALVIFLTLLCLAFYILRPLQDRNYSGVSCGFRWMFWFIPMWLLTLLPAADRIASRPWWRRGALALLLVSVLSASYSPLNPWTHPWLYQYWSYLGWITAS